MDTFTVSIHNLDISLHGSLIVIGIYCVPNFRTMEADKVVVNVLLLSVYVFFFGQQSIKKYIDKNVFITKHEENSLVRPGPGNVFLIYH